MTSPQDDREEFGPDVDDGGTATSPDKEQADDESAAAPPEESPTQAAPAEAGDEAVASDGADELAPEEPESVAAPAGREPGEADEAGSIEQLVEHEADAPESDPVEANGEPEAAPPVVASADSAGSRRQAVEPADSEQVGSGSDTEDPAEAGRQAGGADMAEPVDPVEVEPEAEELAEVDPVENAGLGTVESDAEPVEVEPETEVEDSAEPGQIVSEADETGADDARSEPDAAEAGPAESGAESAEPVEAESEADEPAGSEPAGLTEPEARTEGSVAPPVESADSGESAESVPDDLEEGRIEPVEAVTDVEADEAPEGREAIDSRADDGQAAGDGSESIVEPHEERKPVVDEGGGAAPHEPDEEPDAADSVPEIDEPSPGAGSTGVVEPDAGTTARSLAAEAADASTPLPEAVSGTEEPSSDAGEPAAGAEESELEQPIDLPPSYPPIRRPRPLPIPGREKEEDSSETRPRRGWLSTVAVVLVVLALSAFIKTHIVQTFELPSGSTENTLQSDDQVAVRMYHAHDVHRGDVVVFADPGGWLDAEDPSGFKGLVRDGLILTGLLPRNSGHHLIKRVIGVAGDRVTADGHGVLTVNGVPLNETYVKEGTVPSSVPFDVIVPEGCVWVMGDNRSNSLDSRFHQDDPHGGAVPLKDVVGVATNVVWPVSRWSSLDNGEAVFADVSGSGP